MPRAGVLSNFFLLFCAGNAGGSYLTIMSSGGLQFGILQIIGSFGNVWADQAYWQVRHTRHFFRRILRWAHARAKKDPYKCAACQCI